LNNTIKKKIHTTGLTQPHIFACPKPRPGFPTPYFVFFFTVQLFEVVVRFDDVGEIVDHLCLNFIL